MLRNILLLVEPTPSAQVAKKVACDIATRANCNLTALEIHATDSATQSDDLTTSPHSLFIEDLSHSKHDGILHKTNGVQATRGKNGFSSLKTDCQIKVLSGPKYTVLSRELENNDLTVIGRDGNFAEHWSHDAKEIINLLLEYRARPLIIATPEEPATNDDVLIAYDGSPGSSRAVQFFTLMGLAQNRNIHVLSVNRKKNVARSRVDSLIAYLNNHHIGARSYAVNSRQDTREIIVDMTRQTHASLVIAGAFGTNSWKRSVFGSVTDYLIRYCPVPLFTCQ
jgi:nucleotide-binding universal stress UspA family protein